MKKIVALLICALLIAAFAIPAFAADEGETVVTITSSKTNVKYGDEFVLTFKIDESQKYHTAAINLNLNPEVFEVATDEDGFPVYTTEAGSSGWTILPNEKCTSWALVRLDKKNGFIKNENVNPEGVMFTVTFRVIAECPSIQSITSNKASIIYSKMVDGKKENLTSLITVNGVSINVTGEHTYGDWSETKAPTCDEAGEKTRECTKCGHKETAEIATIPHSYESVVTAPTCEEKGYTTYTCACGDSYVDDYVPATGHEYGEWYETKAPTCTVKGEKQRDCANCDHFETDEVDVIPHDYKAVVTAPTCTEQGYTTYTCKCGDSYKDNYVPATGHDMGDWYVETPATCEATGTDRRDCANCDHYETRTTKALGHNYTPEVTKEATCKEEGVKTFTCQNDSTHTYTEPIPKTTTHTASGESVVIKAPTCTETGISSGTCAVCGVNMDEFETPALGHDMGEWYVKTDSTCTAEGEKRSDCSKCDHYDSEVIEKKDHTYESVVTKPTCTKNGYTTHTCSVCGNSYETPGDKALGHEYTSEVTTEPGCETKGVRTYTCVRGDHSYTEDIAATGHSTANMEVTKEPTCEEDGVMSGKCSVCGKELSNEKIPAIGHNYELTEEVAPTCTEKGHKTYVCKNDASHTKTEEFDALGHTYGDWISVDGENHKHVCACGHEETVAHKWDTGKVTVEPTHTETGIKTYECKDCHAIREEEVAKTTKHEYTDKAEQIVDEDGKVDTKYHTGICACGEQHKEKHSYDIEGDVIKEPTSTERGEKEMFCACGHKIVVKIKADGTLDSEPGMGDITGQVVMTGIAAFSMIAAAAYVFTRKRIA